MEDNSADILTLERLEKDQARLEGQALLPDGPTAELSTKEGKVFVPRDADAEKAATAAVMAEAIRSEKTLDQASRRDAAQATGELDTGGAVVQGPEGNRLKKMKPVGEDDELSEGLDNWSGDNLLKASSVGMERKGVRSENMRKNVDIFVKQWRKDYSDSGFVVKMNADKDGKLWIQVDEGGRVRSFPAWMLVRMADLPKKKTPDTEVPTRKGEFPSIDRAAAQKNWENVLGRMVIGGKRKEGVRVEMTGPWEDSWKASFEKKKPGMTVKDNVRRESSSVGKSENEEQKALRSYSSDLDAIPSGGDGSKKRFEKVMKAWGTEPLKVDVRRITGRVDMLRFTLKKKDSKDDVVWLPMDTFLKAALGGEKMIGARGETGNWGSYVKFDSFNVDGSTRMDELKERFGEFELDGQKRKIAWGGVVKENRASGRK